VDQLLRSDTSVIGKVYDMCKAADRGMVIEGVRLLEKHGGKSGSFIAGD